VAEDRQRKRQFFSGMLRGVSDPCEGSKILTFLYGTRRSAMGSPAPRAGDLSRTAPLP